MNRNLTVIAALIAMAVCVVPVVAEDSDGETGTYRVAPLLIQADFVIPDYWSIYFTDNWYFALDGSDSHRAMLDYLSGASRDLPAQDDRDLLSENLRQYVGDTLHVYAPLAYDYMPHTIYCFGEQRVGREVKDAYGEVPQFTIKPGDTFRVTLGDRNVAFGNGMIVVRDVQTGSSRMLSPGDTYEYEPRSVTTVEIGPRYVDDAIYTEYTIEWEGNSVPDGSPVLFAAVCFVIAALFVALIILASRKPKWSR